VTNFQPDGNRGIGGFDPVSYSISNSGIDLNSENIKSLNVLKGPAASALYGSRASNGVIVIETKEGNVGGEKTDITIKSSVGVRLLNDKTLPQYQREYGAGYTDSFLEIDDPFTEAPNDKALAARYTADASWGPAFDSSINVYQWDAFYNDSPNYGKATPWVPPEHGPRYFFQPAYNNSNSVNISGKMGGSGYYSLGLNQSKEEGAVPNSKIEDYKVTFKSGYPINDELMVTASVKYTQHEGLGRPARGYTSYMTGMRQWGATNVDWKRQKEAYFQSRENQTWNMLPDRSGPLFNNNPYWDRYENFQNDQRKHLIGYTEAKYDLLGVCRAKPL
jgi:TonB-dependent SusC/RagA subfamily outer membrane receptor